MKYNIDFEVAAAVFLVLFYFFHKIQFYTNTKGSKLFQKIIISLLIACITDFVTALSISFPYSVPVSVNVLLNTIYFEVAPFSTFLVILYLESVLESEKDFKLLNSINIFIYCVYTFMVCSGPLLNTMFYFDENRQYQHGPLYVFLYIVPMLSTLVAIILLLINSVSSEKYISFLVRFAALIPLFGAFTAMFVGAILIATQSLTRAIIFIIIYLYYHGRKWNSIGRNLRIL